MTRSVAVGLREIFFKEIAVQYLGYAQKHVRVYAFAVENGIHVGAFAAQFACEPAYAALLPAQFRLDKGSYVYHG